MPTRNRPSQSSRISAAMATQNLSGARSSNSRARRRVMNRLTANNSRSNGRNGG
jgi:hypothetical protein